jgi:hypothetical protein
MLLLQPTLWNYTVLYLINILNKNTASEVTDRKNAGFGKNPRTGANKPVREPIRVVLH